MARHCDALRQAARSYHAALCLAATLYWLNTGFNKTP
jgi:hypothetical protein